MMLGNTKYEIRNALCLLFCALILSGCVVRTYKIAKDRVDQNLSEGNRGYLQGRAPEAKERKKTRPNQVVEIEFRSPLKFEKMPAEKTTEVAVEAPLKERDESVSSGNQGYIVRSEPLEIQEPTGEAAVNLQKYTVLKGDTLQKISQKFYGTSKKWNKIYEVNKDKLRGPDKIYPGQVIYIPLQSLGEAYEKIK